MDGVRTNERFAACCVGCPGQLNSAGHSLYWTVSIVMLTQKGYMKVVAAVILDRLMSVLQPHVSLRKPFKDHM
jgi:hypothetical protein